MSNQEPQAFGLIKIKTTFGTLDIELFTKQCPKATRNFVQLCLDGYYERTLFERVEKDFIAVGGGHAEEDEDEDEPFLDEFHSRLRFSRRGLLATANVKKNANGPKFFFTLGSAPELQNKHTIFGRVKGDSIYALVDLNECQVDDDLRPFSEQSILEVEVVENPYPDLEPRLHRRRYHKLVDHDDTSSDDTYDPLSRPKPDPSKAKQLSFYHDDDDDSEDDEKEAPTKINIWQAETSRVPPEVSKETSDLKTKSGDQVASNATVASAEESKRELMSDDEMDEKAKRLSEIRAQILQLKQQIENDPTTKKLSERRKDSAGDSIERSSTYNGDQSDPSLSIVSAHRKSKKREQETIELVTNFKKKLKQASKKSDEAIKYTSRNLDYDEDADVMDELALLDKLDGEAWLKHKFDAD